MPKLPKLDEIRFWPLLGLIIVVDIVWTFLYTVILPGLSVSGWADVQSTSAFVLALGSAIPVFVDAGRGFGISGKMGGSKADQHEALTHERSLREIHLSPGFGNLLNWTIELNIKCDVRNFNEYSRQWC